MTDRIIASEYFSIIPEAVLYANISDRAVRLYGVLRRYADEKTNQCYPSRNTLATRLNTSTRSIDRAMDELVELGAVTKKMRKLVDSDGYTSNLYTLNVIIAPPSAYMPDPSADMRHPSAHVANKTKPIKHSQLNNGKKKKRAKDLIFEEVANQCGIDWNKAPANELGRLNKAVKQLKEIDATVEEIALVANWYKKNWKNITLTPTAIVSNWSMIQREAKEKEVKKHNCETDGHGWVDLTVIDQCRFCKEERTK